MQPVVKILLSALLIYAVGEFAKRSSLFGAIIASLPIISILAMIWLWHDTHDAIRIARLSRGIFWLVLPSLVLFALLPPLLLRWNLAFSLALGIASGATVVCYFTLFVVLTWLHVEI